MCTFQSCISRFSLREHQTPAGFQRSPCRASGGEWRSAGRFFSLPRFLAERMEPAWRIDFVHLDMAVAFVCFYAEEVPLAVLTMICGMVPLLGWKFMPREAAQADRQRMPHLLDDRAGPTLEFWEDSAADQLAAEIFHPHFPKSCAFLDPAYSINRPLSSRPARFDKMGISRDSRHKRAATGAKRAFYRKKRAFELGRQPANTRIGAKRIHVVRTRGGNHKYRALRLDSGNFAWASEGCTRKTRVIAVAYHPSNNELVRTNTLTKSAVVQVDAAPFRQWYEAHYGQPLGRRRQQKQGQVIEETKKSKSVEKKQAARFAASGKVDPALEKQFEAGRLYAVISSRPGQSGRCDGYILEGEELAFYQRKLHK